MFFNLLGHLQLVLEVAASDALLVFCDFLGCTACHELSSAVAAFRSHVDDVVGTLDDFHVMLDDEDAVSALDEGIEGCQQPLDVVEVEAGGGLVEDEEGGVLLLLSDEVG